MPKRSGFTLIELLVVIAIIGIMMAIVQPMLTVSASKTREFECQSNLKQVSIAVHAYTEDYGAFPSKLQNIDGILQDKTLLRCSKTTRDYFYRQPPTEAGRDTVIASCINPRTARGQWPHRFGNSYLALTAGGEVRRMGRK